MGQFPTDPKQSETFMCQMEQKHSLAEPCVHIKFKSSLRRIYMKTYTGNKFFFIKTF